ncbi:hypothetical protein JCM33374_g3652 [Metschnikowia sp. JCM 33374]|nr:hypothetical protein JCM33374_g3652 [Metschnikowia sp. JCM 33374]
MAHTLLSQHLGSSSNVPSESSPDNKVIQIPKSSFTAFRLLYATSAEISHLSTSVFLGKVPDAWIKLSNKPPLFSKKKSPRHSTRSWISNTALNVKKRVTKYTVSGPLGLENIGSIPESSLEDINQRVLPSEIWEGTSVESSSTNETEHGSRNSHSAVSDIVSLDSAHFDNLLYGKTSRNTVTYTQEDVNERCNGIDLPKNDSFLDPLFHQGINSKIFGEVSQSKTRLQAEGSNPPSENIPLKSGNIDASFISEIHTPNEHVTGDAKVLNIANPKLKSDRKLQKKSDISNRKNVFQLEDLHSESSEPKLNSEHPKMLSLSSEKEIGKISESFSNHKKHSRGEGNVLKVQFADPNPEESMMNDHLKKEYVIAEKEHYRTIRRIQSLAHDSKGKPLVRSSKLKLKLVDNILRKRASGEIIRVDKMLVMIKKVQKLSSTPNFNVRDGLNTFIHDHWKEYFVVLKTTDNHQVPLHVQLFEVNKGKNFKSKPEHSFNLSKSLKAGFFSLADKTISVTDLSEDVMKIFIMNTKYTTVAYKWLYMINEILDDDLYSMVKIHLAGESIQININIPPSLLKKSLQTSNFLKLYSQSTGYIVETDVLFTYLKSKIDLHLRGISSHHVRANSWAKRNPNPTFCFKFYDRIEWAPFSGKLLLLQSQLLRDESTLEYRQMTKVPLFIRNSEGRKITRPFPIEGFLARITNSSGKEYSKFRAFYKIQYFFSSENILFFSSFFRGLPPSPNNELLKENVNRELSCLSLPDVYVKNPYEINEDEHIQWLSDTSFEKLDNEAVEEFSRKLQQIVGARAMVDLCAISEVKPVPFHDIQARHLYFQSYLWYSSPKILEDKDIVDSCFEIELYNGSSLKLLAPSRSIRDEWVKRLKNLVTYWRESQSQSTIAETFSKLNNMANLNSEDYVDSNLSFGPDSLEIKKSIANGTTITTSTMAMSTSILYSGYLYQKQKKHSNFSRYFVVLCPGYLLIFTLFKRSKVTGVWKNNPYFERYMTIPISECYIYSESSAQLDLVDSHQVKSPGECDLPRLYPDGWKSSEEEFMRCFSIWFGGKRALRHGARNSGLNSVQVSPTPKNPGIVHMTRKSGMTGKTLVFLARSRQERENWVHNILQEINRFSSE